MVRLMGGNQRGPMRLISAHFSWTFGYMCMKTTSKPRDETAEMDWQARLNSDPTGVLVPFCSYFPKSSMNVKVTLPLRARGEKFILRDSTRLL